MVMTERILIVDDIGENRKLLQELIKTNFEASIDEAESGISAIEMTRKNHYDIIFLDVRMPGMDGFETAREIGLVQLNPSAVIIFLTAHDKDRSAAQKGFEAGGIDYITKPINPEELKRLLQLYLRFIRKEKEINGQLKITNESLQKEIQERKKLENQLLKTKENFKNIVGKSNAAILIIDNDGILRFINPSGEAIFGREAKELIGECFGLVLDNDKITEINIVRKNGEIGIGEIASTRTFWENKPAWLVLINDITEHKKLQENLEFARERAQESDRLKSAFLSNMSHEIRTPMNGIMGFVNIMLTDETLKPEERRELLKITHTCGEHLLRLINDIIDISKIEAGQMTVKLADSNINALFNEIIRLFSSDQKILSKDVALILDIPDNKGEQIIKTDEYRLRQILINLLGNALKFTDTGTITLGYHITEHQSLEVYVKDTGKGIPEDKRDIVFERFTQVEDDTSVYKYGTGLGLAITRSLVYLLGGDIRFESKLDKGSTFFFTLPIDITDNESEALKISKKGLDPVIPKKNNSTERTILIAEDSEINFVLLNSILLSNKLNIKWVKNGEEAVNFCRNNNIDLVLMDIKMPNMSGLEATKEIRRFNPGIPIIAQTAYALEGEKEKCLEVGCNDYIAKPFNQSDLINLVNKYI